MFCEKDSLILCIDIQEKLVRMLNNPDEITANCKKIMKLASILNIPSLITEQYPRGLGETIDEIKRIKDFKIFEKTTFSVFQTDEIKREIKNLNKKNILIFGIETHICVLQTVFDLIDEGYRVYLIEDCCASRDIKNHQCALELMNKKGADILRIELALFEFLKSSKHPKFKEVQALIK